MKEKILITPPCFPFFKRIGSLILFFLIITLFSCSGGSTGSGDYDLKTDPCAGGHTFGQATCPGCGIKYDYEIGEEGPAGGIIFYVADGEDGRTLGFTVLGNGSDSSLVGIDVGFSQYKAHYLEVAPATPAIANQRWGLASGNTEIGNGLTNYANLTAVNTAISDGVIGNGRKDTQIIIAHPQLENAEFAARSASEYKTESGHTDWFLPSITELNLLFQSTSTVSGMPTIGYFFSSSQYNSDNAWGQSFGGGSRGYFDKSNNYSVRAVRAF